MSETRKLVAILVSDVVGYSRLAGADEDRTLARLRGLRSHLIDPAIAAGSRPHRQAHRRRQHHRVPQRCRRSALRDRSDAWRKAQQRQHVGWTEAAGARGRMCSLCAGGANGCHKGEPFARRVYMRRSTAGDGCEAESLLAERDRPPTLGSVMVGTRSPSRLGITHNNSHIIND